MPKEKFDQLLDTVLSEITSNQELQEEQVYKEFLRSGDINRYPVDEEFRSNLISRITKSQKKKKARGFAFKKVCVIFSLVVICQFFIIVVQALGINLFGLYTNRTHTEIKISSDMNDKYLKSIEKDWGKIYFPSYIPTEYVLDDIETKSLYVTTTFKNGISTLSIKQMKVNETITSFVDTENADYRSVLIHDNEGFISEKDGQTTLYMYKEEYLIILNASLNCEEIIRIAESLS